MNTQPRRVGRITVAIGFVAVGSALLVDNLGAAGPVYTNLLLRLWPLFLVGFGLEFLITALLDRAGEGRPVRFEAGGALLLGGALALASVVSAFSGFGPGGGQPSNVPPETAVRSVPAAGARALTVNVDVGRVHLTAHDAPEVRVEAEYGFLGVVPPAWAGLAGEFDLTVEGGETIRVIGRAPAENPPMGLSLGTLQAGYRIYAPAGLAVHVRSGVGSINVENYDGDLELSTNAGGIVVEDSAGTLKAETGSGSVHIARFTGAVTAATNAGPVTAKAVAGDLTIRSGTGVITVEEHLGPGLTAETRTGSIHARVEEPPQGPIVMRTGAGSVTLSLPDESDVTITATTRSGSITGLGASDRPGPARTASRTLGAGTHPVRLEASTGSIHVSTH